MGRCPGLHFASRLSPKSFSIDFSNSLTVSSSPSNSMAFGFRRLCWSPICCILLLWSTVLGSSVATFPATVELDLVFPRNETYAPSPLIPIVFAIQNTQFAAAVDLGYVTYTILEYNNPDNILLDANTRILHRQNLNFTGSDPYFIYASTTNLSQSEGTWMLTWGIASTQCDNVNEEFGPITGGDFQQNRLLFSTKQGAQQPDLVAATMEKANNGTCDSTQGFAFNITTIIDTYPLDTASTACAVVGDPTPTANPCRVTINNQSATSISAALTSSECNDPFQTVSFCPKNKTNAAPRGRPMSVYLLASGTIIVGLVVFFA
ncbi:Hypothetical protein R9X50_00761800 [Acrodontium crateriforme]|uniref:DUF7136 domain-containing protein n=1 Tax=Acrodontium crateriforme TaxID=150365 RepID=A0AAQ3RE85_9PEZI|nr:Hypothetical protein R9X50_00761800 [Acrodontium crateriforme]